MTISAETLPPRARLLGRLFNAEPGEVPAVMLSFGFFFCVLCGYYILRPIRDESGVLLGTEFISYAFSITFAVMLAAVPAFGWLVANVPARRIVPIIYSLVITVLIVFWALLTFEKSNIYVAGAFFVWVNVFVLFVVSLFWSFMAEIWKSDQAKRLYGVISVGGTCGALTGPALIQALVRTIGVANLLLVSAAFLAIALGFDMALRRYINETTGKTDDIQPERSGMLAGALNVWKSPYLLRIGVWTLAGTFFGLYFYLEQARIFGEALSDQTERVEMLARIETGVSLLTMIFELFITGRLMQFIGVGRTMAIGPICAVLALIAVMASPTVAVIGTIMILMRGLDYGMSGPASRVLYTIVAPHDKYRAQNFNDTVVYRGGNASISWFYNAFTSAAKSAGFAAAPIITAVAVPLAIGWAWLCLDLGRRHDRSAAENDAPPH